MIICYKISKNNLSLPSKQTIESFKTNTNINGNENINETKYEILLKNKNKHMPELFIQYMTYVSNKMANAFLTPPAYKPQSISNATDIKSKSLRKNLNDLILPRTFFVDDLLPLCMFVFILTIYIIVFNFGFAMCIYLFAFLFIVGFNFCFDSLCLMYLCFR